MRMARFTMKSGNTVVLPPDSVYIEYNPGKIKSGTTGVFLYTVNGLHLGETSMHFKGATDELNAALRDENTVEVPLDDEE